LRIELVKNVFVSFGYTKHNNIIIFVPYKCKIYLNNAQIILRIYFENEMKYY